MLLRGCFEFCNDSAFPSCYQSTLNLLQLHHLNGSNAIIPFKQMDKKCLLSYTLRKMLTLSGLLIFRAVAESRNSWRKSAKSREIR